VKEGLERNEDDREQRKRIKKENKENIYYSSY
jgi:hypothetical protein